MVGRAILQLPVQVRSVEVEEEYWCVVVMGAGVGAAVVVGRVVVRRVVGGWELEGEGEEENEEEGEGGRSLVRTIVGNMGIGGADAGRCIGRWDGREYGWEEDKGKRE